MPARPRAEIISDLRALLAELDACLHAEAGLNVDDISPKLLQALETRAEPREETDTHEDMRVKSKGYVKPTQDKTSVAPQFDHPKHLRDYTPADDPQWDESVFLGTGDRYDPTR